MTSLPGLYSDNQFAWRRALKESQSTVAGENDPLLRSLTVQDGIDAGFIDEPDQDGTIIVAITITDSTIPIPPSSPMATSGAGELIIGSDGSIVSRVRFSWTESNDTSVAGYETEYKLTSEATWTPGPTTGGRPDVVVYLSPVKDGSIYDIRVRSFNAAGKKSAWITLSAVMVDGKTSPPPDVTGFIAAQNGNVAVLRWEQVTVNGRILVDLAGYELRYGPKGNTTWANAVPLTKVTRGTQITTADLPPGDWTIFIKARDRSTILDPDGNQSLNAGQDDLNFVNTYNVITQVEQAPIWPGDIGMFARHWTGVLMFRDQNLASSYANFEMFDTYAPTPFATYTYAAPEITLGFDNNARIWGSIDSFLAPGATGLADPKLQIDTKTSVSAYDGFENWSIGNREIISAKFRFIATTSVGKVVIKGFVPTIDNEERKQEIENVTVLVGGTTVVFPIKYNKTPIVDLIYEGAVAKMFVADSVTVNGCTVRGFDMTGVDVGGFLRKLVITGV